MSVIGSNIIAGASGTVETGYQIARSLRFNSADSAYLNRTPGSAGNRRTWTVAGWFKKNALSTGTLFSARNGTTGDSFFAMRFESADTLNIFEYSGTAYNWQLQTTQVFRDLGAWMHIVLAVDTTQATASNRVKLYINGVQVTALSASSYPSQNYDCYVNNAFAHSFGASNRTSIQEYLNHYLADVRFIDGQALDPTSFGETDSATGVWVPKAYTGTYGTNGFWLKLDDNSNTTATTLGKDSSGNSNNFTPNNFSVTAGAGNDSLVDSPTNYGTDTGAGGEVRGNYCTLNPTATQGTVTLTNGNLEITNAANSLCNGTVMVTSGKWYWEVKLVSGSDYFVGAQRVNLQNIPTNKFQVAGGAFYYSANGNKYMNGDGGSAYGASYTTNDVIGVALNLDANTLTFYKNNTSQGSISISAGDWVPCSVTGGTQCAYEYNFGQRPFAYTAPSGFKALCTQNLPTPAIGASASTLASANFNVVTDTGANIKTTAQALYTYYFEWIKDRANANNHQLIDTVRGSTAVLQSNTNAAETTYSAPSGNSVGWVWNIGAAAVSNNAGSITSQVAANAAAGIAAVGYTANGANATIGHGLGKAPSLIITKQRNGTWNWIVYHASIGAGKFLYLQSNDSQQTDATMYPSAPSSTVFSIGTNGQINSNTSPYISYCFAEIPGFSKFGTFTGNGSTDGPFIYLGFRPKWFFVKNINVAYDWKGWDAGRDSYNVATKPLWLNLTNAEGSGAGADFLSNGVKIRSSDPIENNSGSTYVFMAFAENPFNYSRAR